MNPDWLDQIKWDEKGLIPVIAQDATTGVVLMFAWMNREALLKTVQKGEAVYWSRSRNRLWHKGEESGHTQKIVEMRIDCDADVLLLRVEQIGAIACHTGRQTCFFRHFQGNQAAGQWLIVDPVLKDPQDIYR